MKSKKHKEVLEKALKKIKPSELELIDIKKNLDDFLIKLKKSIKKNKINADIFIGGSFSKNTLIKKGKYDIDIFVRFDKKYDDKQLSNMLNKILFEFKKKKLIHGSRDYFSIKIKPNLDFEIIPVKKIKKYTQAENVTDLSFFHVKYLNKKLKFQKTLDDIKLAKAFCYAQNCYGAESYINGFSGYSLELLVYYYKGFLNFIKQISKIKDREIIDIEKHYKTKNQVMINMNSSKLNSPIILIDPTFKHRNALAALKLETFKQFQKACKNFIKNPSIKAFEKKEIDFEKLKTSAKKNKNDFIVIEISTNKQKGDIAGTKLFKFYNHLKQELNKLYQIKAKEFSYDNNKTAICFFELKKKKEIIHKGPLVIDKKNSARFKKSHKKTFIKNKRLFAKQKITQSAKDFFKTWKSKNKKKISQMSITKINLK